MNEPVDVNVCMEWQIHVVRLEWQMVCNVHVDLWQMSTLAGLANVYIG